jgi:hypothetical protein
MAIKDLSAVSCGLSQVCQLSLAGRIAAWHVVQNVTTIRNMPYRRLEEAGQQAKILKRKFALGKNNILYIFQGLFGPVEIGPP